MIEVFCFIKAKYGIYLIHFRNFFESVSLILNKIPFESLAVKNYKCDYYRIIFICCVQKCSIKIIQVAYLLSDESIIKREFSAFSSIKDSAPKYVFSLDQFDMSQDGIKHINIEDFLLNKIDIVLF